MLRAFAMALLATTISVELAQRLLPSVGMARANGHRLKPPLAQCQTAQQAKEACACGPAKIACPAGMYCHAFANTCAQLCSNILK